LLFGLVACSSVSVVRLSPGAVDVGPNQRAIAAIQANVTSAYFLFIPIPGNVSLDRVLNQMLIAKAKSLGADKITHVQFDSTPDGGIWNLRKFIGWTSAEARAVAVQVVP
jgi:hypothetical protein